MACQPSPESLLTQLGKLPQEGSSILVAEYFGGETQAASINTVAREHKIFSMTRL